MKQLSKKRLNNVEYVDATIRSAVRVTPPADFGYLASVKEDLRIVNNDTQDELIQGYIDEALDRINGYHTTTGRIFGTQEWELTIENPGISSGTYIRLPYRTVEDVTEVKLVADDGTETAAASFTAFYLLEDFYVRVSDLADVAFIKIKISGGEDPLPPALLRAVKLDVRNVWQPVPEPASVKAYDLAVKSLRVLAC